MGGIMRFLLSVFSVLVFSIEAFAASPPNEFLGLDVCLRYSESPCTLKEFVELAFRPDDKRSWEKTDANQWTLTLNTFDKVSKKSGKVVVAFDKVEEGGKASAAITRMISNGGEIVLAQDGKVYGAADQEISQQMLPSVVVPLIEAVNEKTGRAAQARAKNKGKSAERKKQVLKKDFQVIPGNYYQTSERIGANGDLIQAAEQVEVVKIADDAVKAKISVQCSSKPGDPLTVYDDQILKLKYSSEDGRYTSNLSVDKCNLLVKFGPGPMDTIQGIEFVKVDPKAKGCCISGRFVKK